MKANKLLYILPLAALVACEPEFDDVTYPQSSGADFSKMVTVGNSLTAGFQSNALRREKQENSFPAILATQMTYVGGGDFKQPLLTPGVGIGSAGNAEFGLTIAANCQGVPGASPQPIAAKGQMGQFAPSRFIGSEGPYNNQGVPGAKSFHLLAPGYGNAAGIALGLANPYYARFVDANNPNETMIASAVELNPTFFTLWIGNNDILSYATSGGSGVDRTGNTDVSMYGSNDITDPTAFAGVYSQLITALTANGAKGAVANIPDITSIPYFTTVPIGTDAVDTSSAALLNAGYAAYNGGLQLAFANNLIDSMEMVRRTISFTGGQINTFVVVDPSLTDISGLNPRLINMRHVVPGELMTLTLSGDSIRCAGWGTQVPIGPQYHLTADEIQNIADAAAAYNATIKSLATANGLAFVDAKAKLTELANGGINVNGTLYTDVFGTGGAFSLDGVHPSTRGYAIIANEFIDAINSTYGTGIPKADVNSFPTVE